MKKSFGCVLGFLVLHGVTGTVSCSSKVTSQGESSSDSTSSASTGGTTDASAVTVTGTGGSAGGSLAEAGAGGEGGPGVTTAVATNCEAEDPNCICDESGCYLANGADCVQGRACKSQNCGVTENNDRRHTRPLPRTPPHNRHGECYDHNQPEPNNPCRYCDAANKNRGWTNSSNAVSTLTPSSIATA